MIDYLDLWFSQATATQGAEGDSEEDNSPLLAALATPNFSWVVPSSSFQTATQGQGHGGGEGVTSSTTSSTTSSDTSSTTSMDDFVPWEWGTPQASFSLGSGVSAFGSTFPVSIPKSTHQTQISSQSPLSLIPTSEEGSSPQGSALSLYQYLTEMQWHGQQLTYHSQSTPVSPDHTLVTTNTTPVALSTTATSLSGMTPQVLDTLVARDARRYDGGFSLY